MTDYGCAKHIPSSTLQWRVPVSIQLVLGGIMFIGLPSGRRLAYVQLSIGENQWCNPSINY